MLNKLILVLTFILLICLCKSRKSRSGKHTVYGSPSCGWTVKQLEHLDSTSQAYEFVNCKEQSCPSFVNGFPTTKTSNGDIVVGFNKI